MKKVIVKDKDGSVHTVKNNGYEEQVYIEDHHPAIIDRELFRIVQELVSRGLLVSNRVTFTEDDRRFLRYAANVCKSDEV